MFAWIATTLTVTLMAVLFIWLVVDAIKAHHAKRLAEVVTIAKTHPHSTAYELASHMTWSMRGKKWEEFPPTQKWFAMGEALSHVEYLVDAGRLVPQAEDGKITYGVAQK